MTPEKFMRRVRVDPVTGCWHWRGYVQNGVPTLEIGPRGESRKCSARRVALEMFANRVLRASDIAKAGCGERLCICPHGEHSVVTTRSRSMQQMMERGGPMEKGAFWRARSVAARRSGARLLEHVASIRERLDAGEAQDAIAADIGCSQSAISKIHCGQSWKELCPLALMAQQAGLL